MTDHDREGDTIRTSLMREAANYVARQWAQYIRPLPLDRVFYVDGIRVRVTVDEYKTADDTKPVFVKAEG